MTRAEFLSGVEEILGLPKRSLRIEDDRASVAQWTSLADVKIFSFIEAELGIEPDDELIEASTVGDVLRVLERRGAFVSGVAC
jgi:acyl carrier protein